ncbi:MAG: hypothetical protein QXW00_02955 [Candidatus Woesearchaeota archaeon]
MKRRGLEKRIVVYSVIGAAFLLIMMLIYREIYLANDENAEKEICKESVLLYSKTAVVSGKPLSDSLRCPTKYLKLDPKDAEVKNKIANELYDCWDNFYRGQLELFDPQNGRFCVVCSVISFSEKNKKIDGFSSYLASTKIYGKNETYLEFLSNGVGSNYDLQAKYLDYNFQIDTSNTYAVILLYDKISRMSYMKKAEIGGISGLAAGGVVAGVIISLTGVGLVAGIIITATSLVAGAASGAIIGTQAGASKSEWTAAVALLDEKELQSINCDYLVKANSLR